MTQVQALVKSLRIDRNMNVPLHESDASGLHYPFIADAFGMRGRMFTLIAVTY